jgi:Ribbon-helix-helix domain
MACIHRFPLVLISYDAYNIPHNEGVCKGGKMTHKRTNIYLTEKQLQRLEVKSEQENLPVAELVRRAIDAYLAWDDPMYQPDRLRVKSRSKAREGEGEMSEVSGK